MDIAKRIASRPNFSGYTYKDEMISDGIENALRAIKNFTTDKTDNSFGYFTQIIWFAFLRRMEQEKKQAYIRAKVSEKTLIEQGLHGEILDSDVDNVIIAAFVKDYEEKIDSKRSKKILYDDEEELE